MQHAGIFKYTFEVAAFADKNLIKNAIEKKFPVHVVSISTTLVKGRSKRVGQRKVEKKLPAWKKAVIALKKDEKIAFFEQEATK